MVFPFLKPTAIEAASEGLLAAALGPRPRRLPIDLDAIIFDHLAEAERLSFNNELELESQNGEQVLGRMLPNRGRIEVCRTVKERGPLGRYRFTVAHELGHWVLHRPFCLARLELPDLFDPGAQEEGLISLNRNVFPPSGRKIPTEEWQANTFAAMLLIPAQELASEFNRRFGLPQVVLTGGPTIATLANELAAAQVGTHEALSAAFEVSVQAMAIALVSRGYVTDQALLL